MLRDAEQGRASSDDLDMDLVAQRRGNIDVILTRVIRNCHWLTIWVTVSVVVDRRHADWVVAHDVAQMARHAIEHADDCPSCSEARYRAIGGVMHLPNEEIAALIFY